MNEIQIDQRLIRLWKSKFNLKPIRAKARLYVR